MKTKKTNKTSTRRKPVRRIIQFEPYLDYLNMKQKPMCIEGIERIGESLLKWAMEDKNARILRPFFTKRGISMQTVKKWGEKSDKFAGAVELAKATIGDRLLDGGYTRKYEASLVTRGLPKYDKEWKDLEIWRASLKTTDPKQQNLPFIIEMPSFKEKEDEAKEDDS